MQSRSATLLLLLVAASAASAQWFECQTANRSDSDVEGLAYGPTCSEIVEVYPRSPRSRPREDLGVMCPFLRMLERVGALSEQPTVGEVANATLFFGCGTDQCLFVATVVAAIQNQLALTSVDPLSTTIDLFNLYHVPGLSHDCGFTFAVGAENVQGYVRDRTLARFAELSADNDGRVSLSDILQVKAEACKRDYDLAQFWGITPQNPVDEENETLLPIDGEILEIGLLYSYLGGVDQGYVLLSDIERIFNGKMVEHKTKYLIDTAMRDLMVAAITSPSA